MRFLQAKERITDDQLFMRINDLTEMVDPVDEVFEERVLEDIKKNGLNNPLIVVRLTDYSWMEDRIYSNPDIKNPPTAEGNVYYRVQCGNVRLRAAKKLGYDAVSCVVLNSIKEAEQLCATLRKAKW